MSLFPVGDCAGRSLAAGLGGDGVLWRLRGAVDWGMMICRLGLGVRGAGHKPAKGFIYRQRRSPNFFTGCEFFERALELVKKPGTGCAGRFHDFVMPDPNPGITPPFPRFKFLV